MTKLTAILVLIASFLFVAPVIESGTQPLARLPGGRQRLRRRRRRLVVARPPGSDEPSAGKRAPNSALEAMMAKMALLVWRPFFWWPR